MITVRLTDDELRGCACMAGLRFLPGLRDQRDLPDGRSGGERDGSMLAAAACAECAVGKCLNVFWNGAGNCGLPDMVLPDGTAVEVRYSAYSSGLLHVYPHEADGSAFVLVTGGKGGQYNLRGWLWGHEAKRQPLRSQKEGRKPAHWAAQSELRDIAELLSMRIEGQFLF